MVECGDNKILESRDVRWIGKIFGDSMDEEEEDEYSVSATIKSDPMEPKQFKFVQFHKVSTERERERGIEKAERE
jgi:hypothetical protein